MSKIVAMIPARLGSQRIQKKNLRLLNGKPLIAYCIEAAKKSEVFDDIYINSEADIFGDIAGEYGIHFYKRSEYLASNRAINDEFAFDFIKNISGDVLVQLLPTSPLITPDEIGGFVRHMLKGCYDTLVSVENHKIACVYEGRPINFELTESHKSSQTMVPVQSYATVLMAWQYKSFLENMRMYGCAYYGGTSKIGYYVMKGLSTIDVDNEEDLELAKVALKYRNSKRRSEKQFYTLMKRCTETTETEVSAILKKDGVIENNFENENLPLVTLIDIINQQDNTRSWSYRIINTENNSATIISQLPCEGNRLHYHPNWNEWWYIIDGEWDWEIEGEIFRVRKGDVVFIEKNKLHRITAAGNKPAIRLAVSKDLVPHIYPEGENNDN